MCAWDDFISREWCAALPPALGETAPRLYVAGVHMSTRFPMSTPAAACGAMASPAACAAFTEYSLREVADPIEATGSESVVRTLSVVPWAHDEDWLSDLDVTAWSGHGWPLAWWGGPPRRTPGFPCDSCGLDTILTVFAASVVDSARSGVCVLSGSQAAPERRRIGLRAPP